MEEFSCKILYVIILCCVNIRILCWFILRVLFELDVLEFILYFFKIFWRVISFGECWILWSLVIMFEYLFIIVVKLEVIGFVIFLLRIRSGWL